MKLNITDTFNKELPADSNLNNSRRQVFDACYSFVSPAKYPNAQLIHTSEEMLHNIGLESSVAQSKDFIEVFSGNQVVNETMPFAMCYGGHQFGHWAGQLGDGRAINLFEINHLDRQWALQLKGAGATPYSRSADGLAVLRSSIREYLCSEAMYHLGVPTTRALSIALSGEEVLRDMMYDGNSGYEKGAIVCRAAPTFIRFGNFEILSARKDEKTLIALLDYTVKHFFPEIVGDTKSKAIALLQAVTDKTLDMILEWQRVGFVHGVMNTDNMSILGLTIDFGPYGWLEGYDQGWTPNTTDNQFKRYRYGNQANIGLWNLAQLANALYTLVGDAKPFEEILEKYKRDYRAKYPEMMASKIGLTQLSDEDDTDLLSDLEEVLQLTETDMTIFFRNLANYKKEHSIDKSDSREFLNPIIDCFYSPDELADDILNRWNKWISSYLTRLKKETLPDELRKANMDKTNPKYVLRNYMAQLVIDDANEGNYNLLSEIFEILKHPYSDQPENEKWFAKRPEWARHKVGCSKLSCSS